MQGHRYRVKAGDSLSSIAQVQLGRARLWPRIFAYNNRRDVVGVTGHALKDPDKLRVGQELLMPPPDHVHGRVSHGADHRHPLQTTRPVIVPQTAPAAAAPAAASGSGAHTGAGAGAGGGTTVNSFPFKYKLDLIPKQTVEGANYTATLTFDGTVTIWLDKQIPLATVTNKGAEAAAKQETDSVFGKLLQGQKITWEPGSRTAKYENMLTVNAHGAQPSLASVGFAMSSDNLVPALRFKFRADTLKGKIGNHLFHAEDFTVTVDLRPKAQDPDNTRRPYPVPVPVPVRAPVRAPEPESWWQRTGHWAWDHRVEVGVTVAVAAYLASNYFTAGADAEGDPAVIAWGARTIEAARAARALTPALAH